MTNVRQPTIEDCDGPETQERYRQIVLGGTDPESALVRSTLEETLLAFHNFSQQGHEIPVKGTGFPKTG